jgi:5-methylcytosine-specific restriction endonuclease McrA
MKPGVSGWEALGFETYQEYLLSELWCKKREWILECFNYKCQKCGTTINLQVHHKDYTNVGNEKLRDVIVLCKHCHKEEHHGSSD